MLGDGIEVYWCIDLEVGCVGVYRGELLNWCYVDDYCLEYWFVILGYVNSVIFWFIFKECKIIINKGVLFKFFK